MRSILLVAAASLQLAAHAQLTNGCFTIGGPDYDLARAVVQTTDGGYAFAGLTISYHGPITPQDMYVVKTDANGAVQWNTSYAYPQLGSIGVTYDMIQTSDGGFAVAGVSAQQSMGLMKLDAAGAVDWSKQYDTSTDGVDDLYAVVQTPDGGYLLAGSGNVAGVSSILMVLIKTDPDGEIEWSKAYSSAFGTHEAYDAVMATDGGYALCGYHDNGGLGNRFQVLRLDADGNVLWAKGYGASVEIAHAMAATPDSGFVVVGHTRFYGFAEYQQEDGFMLKLDQDGEVEWGHAYGDSTLSEIFHSVVATTDGGYAMAGHAAIPPEGIGAPRIFVAKCDPNGEMLWSQKLNGTNQNGEAWDIIECTDGGLAVTGVQAISFDVQCMYMKMEADGTICPACGPEPYGRDSVAVLSGADMTYTVYDSVATSTDHTATFLPGGVAGGGCLETGIAEDGARENAITIAPNPATDHCIVALGNGNDIDGLEVIGLQGNVILYIPLNGRRLVALPVVQLAPGVYSLRGTGTAGPIQARFVVME